MADPGSGDLRWAIGLMSGTSLDGVDAALVLTDGERIAEYGPALTLPYDQMLRDRLRLILDHAAELSGSEVDLKDVEREVTLRHVEAVTALRNMVPEIVPEIIGFHGQTILHQPEKGRSWQIGDGTLLQEQCGIPVIYDFRARDLEHGGEGAPLVPVLHAALLERDERSVAVLNIGGVANVTLLGPVRGGIRQIWACDTGPGNALLDDWAERHTGVACDTDGALASKGTVNPDVLERLLDSPYFKRPMPKSLDRLSFHGPAMEAVQGLSAEDGAATLVAFTVEAIARTPMDVMPDKWLVAGGGRHNPVLMERLRLRLGNVASVDVLGWDGDALEAQCFALLAVRYLRQLPSSWPQTTGTRQACVAGRAIV
ncbi:anhydro-N-acetylmuramic acid kinase [Gluconobacter thailandicus F149-1 = NBRC 100600]|uniref:Anhydro-N-acetylmuramic acid kinase n=1 Tax=Gluconobacter thailandicus NBRC 3257 TaxID=1381097 RepID=A0ABQ0IVD1_GLUTH|nr:anhydro-N-acetylmuramic acid kinase [Gluconobacter thailandicus]GAN89841.1 anhydro-N-acetylmuramic acid kinase [Gluconobacter frateurii M-2]KXV52034.1 anhydro-N-acetylmuramic acid kinase [Gluconobacter thailandicus]GAC86603.1 anhydro-N-acetylmuramic acid kinase [Gluconobacter thailandicus NBRC 3255]GAD26164.1 anhydro-N-acetylmuramic acid kinase [Gluconobacter thailandicus NBRC 3257]GAN92294.1 anhydro-N-acetylmuramic acid kinase [Gluconobacter thailandicus F149-1 = NBRC 100600]